jgi:hypothetical protein
MEQYNRNRNQSINKKPAKNTGDMVWVGSLGDIRENEDGSVIGWATVDGEMLTDFIPFKEDKMQKDPRIETNKRLAGTYSCDL